MDFSDPPRRRAAENLLPMINVVFLLLIFFLISAQLAPPEPFPVTLPEAEAEIEADGTLSLHLNAAGDLGFRDQTGEVAALAALAAARVEFCAAQDCAATPPRLLLRADQGAPAARLAALLPALARLGFAEVHLVTVRP